MQKYSFLLFLLLSSTALLLYCSGPTEPELNNPYDEESGSYIPAPDLNTAPVTPFAQAAITGGEFTNDYGKPVTSKGVCWSTNENPDIQDNCINDEAEAETFETLIEGLEIETQYFVRAYATNVEGTIYGGQQSFKTRDGVPTLTTAVANEIEAFSALTGGEISDDGGAMITERGVCYSIIENPTMEDNCVSVGAGSGSFNIVLEDLNISTSYFVRSYAINAVGLYYGNQINFTTRDGVPNVLTIEPFNISGTRTRVGGSITDDGGASITEVGVCYKQGSGPPDFSDICIEGSTETNSFEIIIENLLIEQTYSIRAYATTEIASVWGNSLEFTKLDFNDVTNPVTGQTWMDRNLGASRVATSSTDEQAYGDLYQWGRAADGHQNRNSSTISTLSNSNQPGHGDFILVPDSPWDWRSPQNDDLWQGLNGVNNPCPDGYRLPTDTEWAAEWASWSSYNLSGAYASPLKLPVAGSRNGSSGSIVYVGSSGGYWSSTVSGLTVRRLHFNSSNASVYSGNRANGRSARCLKN